MKHKFALLLALLTLALPLVSCSADGNVSSGVESVAGEAAYPYTFTDSAGNLVTLDKRPEKVAVMFSSFADIWKTAGGEISVTVGEAVERGFADESAVLVDEGSGHSTIDNETLIDSGCDLVIGTTDYDCQLESAQLCRDSGIPAASFRVESFEDYLGVLKICCDLTGHPESYEEYGTRVGEKIEELLSSVPDSSPRILFVRAGSSAKSTKAKTTEDNFACRMLSELGCENIADTDSGLSAELSLEAIVDENPEYLFITTMGDESAAREYMTSLLESEGWRELDCVKSGKYYFLPKDLFHFKPNSRWAEAYSYLAEILYPELNT